MPESLEILRAEGLTYAPGIVILESVNFSIYAGEILTILGPNGSGKSTLLNMLLGFTRPTSGIISHFCAERYGYLPQTYKFSPLMPLRVTDFLGDWQNFLQERVDCQILGQMIAGLDIKQLSQLSGGELRKVLLIKAMLLAGDILFLDEPTCWMDESSQAIFYESVRCFNRMGRVAVVIVSHDSIFMTQYSDRVHHLGANLEHNDAAQPCCSPLKTRTSLV